MSKPSSNSWQVMIERRAEKVMRRLDKSLRKRLDNAIQALANNPYPSNSRKLVGKSNHYRLRVGDWRIIYTIRQQVMVILVVKIAPRDKAYNKK